MKTIENPLDIIKRLDVKQNVTIRIIDEPTGKVVQEHIGHNAATHSMLTGIAHYLVGDGVLNQGADILSMWVPQYISLGTMGLTSQDSETITIDGEEYIVPASIGSTPVAPESATAEEKELNAILRFEEYINQTPGFGADGYNQNANNNREWDGLGLPYPMREPARTQDFFDGGTNTFTLSHNNIASVFKFEDFTGNGVDTEFTFTTGNVISISIVYVNGTQISTSDYSVDIDNNKIIFVTAPENWAKIRVYYFDAKAAINGIEVYPNGVINQDTHNDSIVRSNIHSADYSITTRTVGGNTVFDIILKTTVPSLAPAGSRVAIRYNIATSDAVNCELIKSKVDSITNEIKPVTLRSNITYRNLVPEYESQLQNTLDIVYSAFVSVGALAEFRGNRDYIYITEAGLWAKNAYDGNNDNGLLAGYRITPPDVTDIVSQAVFYGNGVTTEFMFKDIVTSIESVYFDNTLVSENAYTLNTTHNSIVFYTAPTDSVEITVSYRDAYNQSPWHDMSDEANRQHVQKSILRIGPNQVAQVVWKIQLGGIEQLNGLRSLYPAQYPEPVWDIV